MITVLLKGPFLFFRFDEMKRRARKERSKAELLSATAQSIK
jgi:hypothetical protein